MTESVVVAEITREMWGQVFVERLWQDVRYALRMMRRAPGFTLVAMLSLALGIGANTAMFTLLNTLMLRSLPVRQPGQLVELLSRFPGEPRINSFSWKVYEHFRDQNHVFSDLMAVSPVRVQMGIDQTDLQAVDAEYVSENLFGALGVRPSIGRLIGPEDDRVGAPEAAAVVISWDCWNARFNRSASVVNTTIVVDGVPATIVGVAARDFTGLQTGVTPELWMPVAMEPLIQRPSHRMDGSLTMKLLGRLKPAASLQQAYAEMRVLDRWRVDELVRTRNAPYLSQFTIEVEPARAGFSSLRDFFAKPLLALMAGVGLLLLIACTNIASMLMARAAARRREMAVRVSLGASRGRLLRQVLTESLLIAIAGAAGGVFLAYIGAGALARILVSGRAMVGMPQHLAIAVTPDARVLLFTAAVAVLTGVLFGLAPAITASAAAPASALRESTKIGETTRRRLFGRSLVVGQVALSLVLLSAGALFTRHLSNLRSINLGFQRDSVLLVKLGPARSGYAPEQRARLYQDLLQRLAALPGVRSTTLSAVTPVEGPGAASFVTVEGFDEPLQARRYVSLNWVAPKYFEVFGTRMLAGRDFAFDDEGRGRVAIVNQAMAKYYFGDRSPIGRQITVESNHRSYEIVGVTETAKYLDLHEAAPRTIYLNAFQEARGRFSQFAIRTTAPPTTIAVDVRRIVGDVLKDVAVAKVTTLNDQMDASIVPERVLAGLSGLVGAFGALLAAIGLYGLLAYTVARRVNEIGVRMALGATERQVVRMVLREALALVAAGLLIGAPLVLFGKRLAVTVVDNIAAASAEQHVTLPVDVVVPLVIAGVALLTVALVAAYVPARRAARINPVDALRSE